MAAPELKRILCAEDDPDIRKVMTVALAAIGGFDLRICGSGGEMVAAAPAFGPDLIVLDVMMPDMDGPSTLRALRALPSTAATPVIFMTAKVQSHELQQYREMGVLGVIAKPFDPLTLAGTIRKLHVNAGSAP